MAINVTQRNATRNQSTADYTIENIFMYGNRYQEALLNNNTGALAVFTDGFLVLRNTAVPGQIIPAIAGDSLANVIGVLKTDDLSLAISGIAPVNYCMEGDIDITMLKLPAGVTLDTVVGTTGRCLRDFLTNLGLVLRNVTENSKFDN